MLTLEFEEHRTNREKNSLRNMTGGRSLSEKLLRKQTLSSFVAGRMKKRESPSEKNWVRSRKAAPKNWYLPEQ